MELRLLCSATNIVITNPEEVLDDEVYGKTITFVVDFLHITQREVFNEDGSVIFDETETENDNMKVAITFVKHGNRIVAVHKEELPVD